MCAHKGGREEGKRGWGGGEEERSESQLFPQATGNKEVGERKRESERKRGEGG